MNITTESGDSAPAVADTDRDKLRRRILSAMVLAPVVVVLIYLGGWPFTGAVALAAVLMTVEWERLTGNASTAMTALQAAVLVLAIVLVDLMALSYAISAALLGALLLGAIGRLRGRNAAWLVLGTVWLALPCIALIWLRRQPDLGLATTIGIFLAVWACDTGAYFAGRAIGGPKLAPKWSPKKTWSGLGGGVLAAAAVGAIWAGWTNAAPVLFVILAAAALAVVAQIGDLAESAVKRNFGAKDSGHLIPGHGGLLDRVDGLLFAAPTAALLTLFGGRGMV